MTDGDARFSSVFVDIAKLRDYCLSEAHPRGRHKARVFLSRLGLSSSDAARLRDTLVAEVRKRRNDLARLESDQFGRRFQLDFDLATSRGTGRIRTLWIIREGEDVLRLTSCYVL